MKKIGFFFVAGMLSITAQAQQFVNGSFEKTEARSCEYNLSNKAFTDMMTGCVGYGGGDEIDIQASSCGRASAPDGKFFVSLATRPNLTNTDAFSIALDESFKAGTTYTISWYERSSTELYNTHDSVIFTLSDSPNKSGTRIHVAYPNAQNWLQKKLTFKAPITGKYLTIENQGKDRGWNFFDAFKVEEIKKTDPKLTISDVQCLDFKDARLTADVKTQQVTVSSSSAIRDLWICDGTGKPIKSLPGSGSQRQVVATKDLLEGEYILLLRTDDGFENAKFVKE